VGAEHGSSPASGWSPVLDESSRRMVSLLLIEFHCNENSVEILRYRLNFVTFSD
jgi:hypothetical protein